MKTPAFRFLSRLAFAYPAEAGHYLEIRCLAPAWDSNRPRPWPRFWVSVDSSVYLANAADACLRLSQEWDVFCGVLARPNGRGSQDDVPFASCLYNDTDGGEEGPDGAIRLLKRSGLPAPDMAVLSGNGVHAYWFLSELVPLSDREARETFKRTLRRLCQAIGGSVPGAHADYAAADPARVLRVPETFNRKVRENPKAVRILRFSPPDKAQSYDWWNANLPFEPIPAQRIARKVLYPADGISPRLIQWASEGYKEGKRHNGLTGAAKFIKHDLGYDDQQGYELFLQKAQSSRGVHALTPNEIEQIWSWA